MDIFVDEGHDLHRLKHMQLRSDWDGAHGGGQPRFFLVEARRLPDQPSREAFVLLGGLPVNSERPNNLVEGPPTRFANLALISATVLIVSLFRRTGACSPFLAHRVDQCFDALLVVV